MGPIAARPDRSREIERTRRRMIDRADLEIAVRDRLRCGNRPAIAAFGGVWHAGVQACLAVEDARWTSEETE